MTWQQYALALEATPRQIRVACRDTLNELGFRLKQRMALELNAKMKIRNKGVVKRFIAVERTRAVYTEQQKVRVGSLATDRFTGWEENEVGGESKQAKQIWLAARAGNTSRQVKMANRLNKGVLTADKAGIGGSQGNRTIGLLAFAARTNNTGLIEIDGKKGKEIVRIVPGQFYKPRKFRKVADIPHFYVVQRLGEHFKIRNVIKWREAATEQLLSDPNTRKLWMTMLEDVIVGRKHTRT